MEKKIENQLSSAVSKLIPADMLDRIEQGIVHDKERTIPMKTQSQHKTLKRFTGLLVAACLLLAVGLVGGSYYRNHMMVTSVVDIDVNPSVAISANRQDRVVKVEAVNEDGKAILSDMDLRHTDLDVAINAIIGSMVKLGYLTAGEVGEILITVQNEDVAKAQAIRSLVVSDVDAALKANDAEAAILNQTVTADRAAEEFAKEQGISVGKAIFVLNLAAMEDTLRAEELAAQSIRELAALIREHKLDVRGIIDYDADDSLLENMVDNIEDNENASQAVLTAAEAKAKALASAGIEAEEASFLKVELDEDDGRLCYEIEFFANGVAYEYKIHAETGEVVAQEQDMDKRPTTDSTIKLTADEAKAKALAHAGVKAEAVRIVRAELEYDDGIPYYEIEFIGNHIAYEYEIHAESGDVLAVDTERVHSAETVSDESAVLTPEQAEDAALTHAGVKRADAVFARTELEQEDGRSIYEVSFHIGSFEFDYAIDATTGAVLSFEKEPDKDLPYESDRPLEPNPPETKPVNTQPAALTAEEAEAIALKHAGVKRADAVFDRTERDEDDGRAIYEIEFHVGSVEYDYEIDALTGHILDAETDRAD